MLEALASPVALMVGGRKSIYRDSAKVVLILAEAQLDNSNYLPVHQRDV